MAEVYQDRLFEVDKRCKKCGAVKSVDEFYRRNGKPISPCIQCRKKYIRAWEAKNPERVAEYKRRWTKDNPGYKPQWYRDNAERIKAKNAKRHIDQREVILAKQREYTRQNRERNVQRVTQWQRENPEKFRAQINRRRALELGAPGHCDAATLIQMYESQAGLCAYCEHDLESTYHVEHLVPLSRGGSNDWTNIALACADCNQRKGANTAEEFMNRERMFGSASIPQTSEPS